MQSQSGLGCLLRQRYWEVGCWDWVGMGLQDSKEQALKRAGWERTVLSGPFSQEHVSRYSLAASRPCGAVRNHSVLGTFQSCQGIPKSSKLSEATKREATKREATKREATKREATKRD